MATDMPVRNAYTVLETIKVLRETHGMSWREISQDTRFGGISFATLNAIYRGRNPSKKTRAMLGLPDEARVVVVYGEIPDGTQAIRADRCACGQWYISNHPRRRKCFQCSPYRHASAP